MTKEFIKALRGQLGVQFIPNGRVPGKGLDCVGLPIVALEELGLGVEFRSDYNLQGEDISKSLLRYVSENCLRKKGKPTPGSVLIFRGGFGRPPIHCGILTDKENFIHVAERTHGVCEVAYSPKWQRLLHSCWNIKALKGAAK